MSISIDAPLERRNLHSHAGAWERVEQIVILVFSLFFYTAVSAVPEPQTALQAVDNIRAPGDNFSFTLDVEQQRPDDKTRHFQFDVKVKNNEKSLVTYTEPKKSKGKRILMVGANLWIYIPTTRMPIRISAQQKISSGIANADVARVVYSLDYQADSIKTVQLEDKDSYQLSLSAKNKGAAYQAIELWVATDDYQPIKADFYTKTGRKLKSIYYQDYQLVLGKKRPMLLEVHDALNPEDKIFMRYSELKLADTPDMYFQKSYLPRLPR